MKNIKEKPTKIKKLYYSRFVLRCLVFVCAILIYIFMPNSFDVMQGFDFFTKFNVLHVFYVLWLVDISLQLMPLTGQFSIGSLKHFKCYMKGIKEEFVNFRGFLKRQSKANVGALKVLVLWTALTLIIGTLKIAGIISHKEIFLFSVFFYLCDLICVLFFCPFQKWLMKNKCCATCRIFNWDHMMMFSPFLFVFGFYTWSLTILSFISMLIWEFTFFAHPERFFEETNQNLRCKNCKEKMCRK